MDLTHVGDGGVDTVDKLKKSLSVPDSGMILRTALFPFPHLLQKLSGLHESLIEEARTEQLAEGCSCEGFADILQRKGEIHKISMCLADSFLSKENKFLSSLHC